MNKFEDNPFDEELEVIATLRDRAIEASIAQDQMREQLISALQYGIQNGISVDALSDASGLTTDQIRSLTASLVNN
jgi:hypothetical protein